MPPILLLAPLHGVTTRVFRNAFFRHFPDFDGAVAPFILSVPRDAAREKHFRDLLPGADGTFPLVPQLLSNDAESFVQTAEVLAGYGYREVNWNLGCPYPMVADKKRGSGLLPFPGLIERFLETACARSALPVSVKVRLGRNDRAELLALAPVLNAFPLTKVIIHPRVGAQMYEGRVDLDGFSAAAAALRHPIVYNGDIRDAAVYASLAARFPSVGEWMIGRWAIADPFLPARIKGKPVPADAPARLRAFHDELRAEYRELLSGERHVLDKLKEIWGWLSESFPEPEEARKRIRRTGTPEAYERAVDAVFSGAPR